MSYDALAESIILVGTRQPRPVTRLSRRPRFAAMAVDVAGDIAATMFLRRSVGCDVLETWVLTQREDDADCGRRCVGSVGVRSENRTQRARRQLKKDLTDCCTIELDRRAAVTGFHSRHDQCAGCG